MRVAALPPAAADDEFAIAAAMRARVSTPLVNPGRCADVAANPYPFEAPLVDDEYCAPLRTGLRDRERECGRRAGAGAAAELKRDDTRGAGATIG